jgi:hypothetical protein
MKAETTARNVSIAVVIPCYREKAHILDVLARIGPEWRRSMSLTTVARGIPAILLQRNAAMIGSGTISGLAALSLLGHAWR